MKAVQPIIIFVGVALAGILVFLSLPWFIIYMQYASMPDPPKPLITQGEFPFKLVYEINGEQKVVEDTVICKYDGIGMNEGQGKYRKWKSYIAGSGEPDVLLVVDGKRKVYCYVGSAEYYMDDKEYPEPRPLTPRVYTVGSYAPEELLAKYKIKLISWGFSDPIVNTVR